MSEAIVLPFEQAKQIILNFGQKLITAKTEFICLSEAQDKILAEPIISPINVPSFDQSAMDGYALRFSEVDLNRENRFTIQGSIFAGDEILRLWEKNSALRVMTGAPLPSEADLVIMQEDVEKQGHEIIFTPNHLKQKMNIRYIGENVKKGAVLFECGEKLTLPKLVTLASLGITHVKIYSPLKVAIFSTGNELVSVGQPLSHSHTIYDSNRFMLKQILNKLNCTIIDLCILPDDLQQIKQALSTASKEADLMITSGGVSVGDADFTRQAIQELGTVEFWKIAMKPGKPFAFGQIGTTIFCGLPGNPVSAMITFYQLVKPMIEQAQHQENKINSWKVKTDSFLKKRSGRLDFQRGNVSLDEEGNWRVKSVGQQESHLTTSFHEANCFIILEQERGDVAIGEMVTIECFDSTLL